MQKTFTVAGVSTENGAIKFRVANDLKGRIAMLTRCGNTGASWARTRRLS